MEERRKETLRLQAWGTRTDINAGVRGGVLKGQEDEGVLKQKEVRSLWQRSLATETGSLKGGRHSLLRGHAASKEPSRTQSSWNTLR